MTAYSEKELHNCSVLSEARHSFELSEISEDSYRKIREAYFCKLYTPSFFISLALGLVTAIAVLFAGLLFGLLADGNFTALCFFMMIISYVILEVGVKTKKYFNAGVDNILMVSIIAFAGGIFLSFDENPSWILFNSVLMVIALWLCLRFADALMAMVSATFFLMLCFLILLKAANAALIYFPFVMMIIIGALYFLIQIMNTRIKFVYEKCITALTVFLLIAFYASGNYWVIAGLQSSDINSQSPIAFGTLFWIFTIGVPLVYIAFGVGKKDLILLRTGLFLIAATILTYKYYFDFIPIEIELLIIGLAMVLLSYLLIRWLKITRYGFTSEATSSRPSWRNVEALIIAETMSGKDSLPSNDLMSGGSGGGGGASSDF